MGIEHKYAEICELFDRGKGIKGMKTAVTQIIEEKQCYGYCEWYYWECLRRLESMGNCLEELSPGF
jgi:hypothetical protein